MKDNTLIAGEVFKTRYCREWVGDDRELFEPKTEEEARQCHENREWYTAVLGGEKPFCVVELRKDFIAVDFLDKQLRQYMSYQFYEVAPDKIFLRIAIVREYNGDSNEIVKATNYKFAEEGSVHTSITDYIKREKQTSDSVVDIGGNYDTWPAFRDYMSIIREERYKER